MVRKPVRTHGLKKHVNQMNELESEFLKRQFRKVNKWEWKLCPHAVERKAYWRISEEAYQSIFRPDTELIEFHRKDGRNRILMRGKLAHSGKNICVVFCPDTKEVVTMWTNRTDYHHPNLILENYNAKVDVLKVYKGGRN